MSQAQLGAAAGASRNAVVSWEVGAKSPNASYLVGMAAHGIDISYLVVGKRLSGETLETLMAAARATLLAADPAVDLALVESFTDPKIPAYLGAEEHELLETFRSATADGRRSILTAARAFAAQAAPASKRSGR